ncbi:hypothetical protein AB0D86_48455 [Streptomyces sp. NPDC048324]|uniref:hypothetical protein n=1 Tax=Streptomyces sp. NPDC048324 TaxID=3157205 RepID=UPI00344379CA
MSLTVRRLTRHGDAFDTYGPAQEVELTPPHVRFVASNIAHYPRRDAPPLVVALCGVAVLAAIVGSILTR